MSDLHKSDPDSPYADDLEFVRDYARRNDGYQLVRPVVDFINSHLTPQIIRTVEELEALDPDTLIQPPLTAFSEWPQILTAAGLLDAIRTWEGPWLPAVKITEGAHVRACREALEGEAHDA